MHFPPSFNRITISDISGTLAAGDTSLDKATNLLLFGPPGTGKSHTASAIGRTLVENGYRVLFTRTTEIVQKLQAARQANRSKQNPCQRQSSATIIPSSAVAESILIDAPSHPKCRATPVCTLPPLAANQVRSCLAC
jgi:DNA polymerase III delta prime subunit